MTTPNKINNNGVQVNNDTDDQNISMSMSSTIHEGIKLNYDLLTTPKYFLLDKNGMRWNDGTNNYITPLDKIALIQTALSSIEIPPNSTTLQVDKTIFLTDGTTSNTLDNTQWTGNINSVATTTNATHYLGFFDSATTGYGKPQKVSTITCNPNTSTINATNILASAYNIINNASAGGWGYMVHTPYSGTNSLRTDVDFDSLQYQPSTSSLRAKYILPTCPSLFDDLTTDAGSPFEWQTTTSGTGTSAYFSGTYDATISGVGVLRLGLNTLSSGTAVNTAVFYNSKNNIFSPANIISLTFGFIPLGAGTLSVVGVDVGNVYQSFGIAQGTSSTGANNGIYWRLSSGTASIPTWTLVENNVVKETLTGTNLTGGLSAKWCRATIEFTTNGASYFGTFTNLTNNVTYTTATYTTTSPNAFNNIYLMSGTGNATSKQIAFDYIQCNINAPPIGLTNTSATAR